MATSGKRCSEDGCEGTHKARGLCQKHYDAWLKENNPARREYQRLYAARRREERQTDPALLKRHREYHREYMAKRRRRRRREDPVAYELEKERNRVLMVERYAENPEMYREQASRRREDPAYRLKQAQYLAQYYLKGKMARYEQELAS